MPHKKRSGMARDGQPGALGLEQLGLRNPKEVYWNLSAAELYERAVRNGEGKIAADGPLVVITGQHTGRSPKDKFFVREPSSESQIWWDNNQAMEPVKFAALLMSMHASANMSKDASGDTALFFGLSGTGKTTLSADPHRILIGDDEHGWSENGIFNIEGGCYAKMIRLSAEAEPEIYSTAHRFGTVLENVVMDDGTRELNLDSEKFTENTRAAYPLNYIPNTSPTGIGKHPKNVIFLTADAFGVMPPIAKLTPSQAMDHFLSGFTAKVAGTEKGLGADPEPTFSTCFGAPFLPRHPSEYGNLLRQLIATHQADCWLVNTGWTGGKFGVGRRMPIKVTRTLLTAALDGSLKNASFRTDPYFGFSVPTSVPGVEPHLLYPFKTWRDKADFDQTARKLVGMFRENFVRFENQVDADVKAAAPEVRIAAE